MERESRALFIGRAGPARQGYGDGIRGTGGQNQGSVASGAIHSDLTGVFSRRLA